MNKEISESLGLTRRALLKQVIILSAGTALLPSCKEETPRQGLRFKNFGIDAGELIVLGELTSTIIPTTDTPGAKEIAADQFMLRMIDDCYSPDDQKRFVSGLKAFETRAGKGTGKSFADLDPGQKVNLLTGLEKVKGEDTDLNFFYRTAKSLTLYAYTTSEYYLTKVHPYELVPARFHGCMPVDKAGAKKAS